MAHSVGNELPAAIRPLFESDDLAAHEGITFLVLTTTEDGWPHVAMISVGEIVACGPRALRLALWRNSTASRNLTRTGQLTLALVHGGAGYSLRCSAQRGPDLTTEGSGRLAAFTLQVEDAILDEAPYATLTSGVRFELKDPPSVLPRWEETVRALRAPARHSTPTPGSSAPARRSARAAGPPLPR
jgi:hypothetical protein